MTELELLKKEEQEASASLLSAAEAYRITSSYNTSFPAEEDKKESLRLLRLAKQLFVSVILAASQKGKSSMSLEFSADIIHSKLPPTSISIGEEREVFSTLYSNSAFLSAIIVWLRDKGYTVSVIRGKSIYGSLTIAISWGPEGA